MRFLKAPMLMVAALASISATNAATIVGLTTTNSIVQFDSSGGATGSPLAVTGLIAGHTLSGIDFRPIDGALAGVSVDAAGQAQVYTINTTTGAATAIGGLFSVLQGSTLGIDFNPVPNALRIVSDAEANLRITLGGTGVVNTDSSLTRTSGQSDPDLRVVSAAYSNNVPGGSGGVTTLYVIDALTGSLFNQGIVNFAAPTPASQGPNGGLLSLIGSLGIGTNLVSGIGFDINNLGQAFVSSGNSIYGINLATGQTNQLATIAGDFVLRDIAAAPIPEPSTILISAVGLVALSLLRRRS